MNEKDIFKKVGAIISELSDQHKYLSDNPGSLNEFELELMRANVKFLGDHLEILHKLGGSASIAQQEKAPVSTGQEPLSNTSPAEVPSPETISTFPGANPETAPELPADTKEQEQPDAESVTQTVVIDEHTVEIPATGPPAEEKKPEPVPTVNERMAPPPSTTPTVAGSLGNQPFTDLKSAISLNDKLLFVKDLFNGYSLAYSEALDLVNRFSDYETAKTFLQVNYGAKNNWDSKPATVEKLHAIIARKFV